MDHMTRIPNCRQYGCKSQRNFQEMNPRVSVSGLRILITTNLKNVNCNCIEMQYEAGLGRYSPILYVKGNMWLLQKPI